MGLVLKDFLGGSGGGGRGVLGKENYYETRWRRKKKKRPHTGAESGGEKGGKIGWGKKNRGEEGLKIAQGGGKYGPGRMERGRKGGGHKSTSRNLTTR